MPGLAPVPKKRKQHRGHGGRFSVPTEDAQREALTARCRMLGVTPTKDNRAAAKAAHLGSDMGRVIHHVIPTASERAELWDVFATWCRAETCYLSRIIGITGSPQGSALQMTPDATETDTSLTVDTRTSDERDRDAVTAWRRWQSYLAEISTRGRLSLQSARRETGPALWLYGRPTRAGMTALAALQELLVAAKR